MRKTDYLILAKRIREDVDKHPAFGPHLNQTVEQYQTALSLAQQAVNLGRYLAEHLSVDKRAFLDACGIK